MAITDLEIATRVRNLVSEKSPAAVNVTIPHIRAMIAPALETWARSISEDPDKRRYLEQEHTITLTGAGTYDLTPLVDGTTAKINLHDLRNKTLYTTISTVRTPFTWVSSQAQMNYQLLPGTVPAALLEGTTLRTKDAAGSQSGLAAAEVSFFAITYPASGADLPPALLGDFLMFLADQVVKEKFVDGK
jgi:hypothetical protein